MRSIYILIIIVIANFYGCGASNVINGNERSITNIDKITEEEYVKNASCQTTYQLVNKYGEVSVPIILYALDIYTGENNVEKRKSILNGAFYNVKNRNNIKFDAIIQRGLNDPSEVVRLKMYKLLK